MNNYIDYNIDKYSIGYDYNKNKKNYINFNEENSLKINNDDYKELTANYNYNYENKYINNDKNAGNSNNNYDNNKDDYQRLNILVQNSHDNLKYQEIIKQKELIVNGLK